MLKEPQDGLTTLQRVLKEHASPHEDAYDPRGEEAAAFTTPLPPPVSPLGTPPVNDLPRGPDLPPPGPVNPVRGIDPKGEAGSRKDPMEFIPLISLGGVARVLRGGALKYGRLNWRKTTVEAGTYVSAALRHISEYQDGSVVDRESGEHHLDHAIASLIIMRDAARNGTLADSLFNAS